MSGNAVSANLPAKTSMSPRVAEFAVSLAGAAIPKSARHIMRLSLMDWTAVAICGRDEPVARIVRELVSGDGGAAEATVIGLDARLPARAAALSNGTTSHALDYDDTHFIHVGHTSVVVVSAALAVAQKSTASGRDFLDACLIGVETACRVGDWLGRAHYDRGFHQTATAGAFGAAMACARLLELDPVQAQHALGIASTRASGLKSQFGTMGKPYNAGIAASNGVEAALLAKAGFVSRPDGLECQQGFADTHAGAFRDPDKVLEGLGETFVFEAVQHKFHACCHGLHAMLEAISELQDPPEPESIAEIVITANPQWLRVCNIAEPRTGLEAKFSYRLTAAMALCGVDTGDLKSFTDEVCIDERLLRLRDRVRVETDDQIPDTAARVSIALESGAALSSAHDLSAPLPLQLREGKIRAKAEKLLGGEASSELWRIVGSLDTDNLDDFTDFLARRAP